MCGQLFTQAVGEYVTSLEPEWRLCMTGLKADLQKIIGRY